MMFKETDVKPKVYTSEKDIMKAQKMLRKLGSNIKVTGKFTIGMMSALYTFQRKYLLPNTGELDEITWKELKRNTRFWKIRKKK